MNEALKCNAEPLVIDHFPQVSLTFELCVPPAPSAPSFIHFSELTTTSVNVSWGEPTFPNGIIEGYRLVYEPCSPVEGETFNTCSLQVPLDLLAAVQSHEPIPQILSVCPVSSVACADCVQSSSPTGVSKTVMVDVKGGAPLWLKLRDLVEGVTYNFHIRAKTFIYGPKVEANITTGPGEGGSSAAWLSPCSLT